MIDDIAEQLVFGETGSKLNVIFGGGRQNFIDQSVRDEFGYKGKRTDGKNLIKEWLNFTTSGEKRSYVWNKVEKIIIIGLCLCLKKNNFKVKKKPFHHI